METAFYWGLVILPGLIWPSLCYAYGRIIEYKRIQIEGLMVRGQTFQLYIKAYDSAPSTSGSSGATEQEAKDTVQKLFDLNYHWQAYVLPVVIAVLLTSGTVGLGLIRAGLKLGLPGEFEALILKTPLAAIAASGGAFVWGLYDALRRYRAIDLSPISLHFIWLRLLIAPVMGALATLSLTKPLDSLAAFGLGAFPAKTLLGFARGQAKDRLKISAQPMPVEEPTLHMIQGFTGEIIDRLGEEVIDSTEQLANADPVQLLLRTNLEWKVILDIIDQAILYNYIGEKIKELRPLGIRGAIELVEIGENLRDADPRKKQQADNMVKLIALKLRENDEGIRNLIETLVADVQVNFIWNLWGET